MKVVCGTIWCMTYRDKVDEKEVSYEKKDEIF